MQHDRAIACRKGGAYRAKLRPRDLAPPEPPAPITDEQRLLRLFISAARADDRSLTPDEVLRTKRFVELSKRPILKQLLD